jgi:hypothetical protein
VQQTVLPLGLPFFSTFETFLSLSCALRLFKCRAYALILNETAALQMTEAGW